MSSLRKLCRLGLGAVALRDFPVAAAFLAECLLDVVAMVALAGFLATASARYRNATFTAAALAVAVLVALATVPWGTIVGQLTGVQPAAAQRLEWARRIPAWMLRSLTEGARSLRAARLLLSPSMLALGFACGLVAWGLEGVGLDVLSFAFPAAHLGVTSAIGIYGVAGLVGGLSLLPGGLGSAEAVMAVLLATHGYPMAQALFLTLLCRLVTLWLAVALGWVAVVSLRQRAQPA